MDNSLKKDVFERIETSIQAVGLLYAQLTTEQGLVLQEVKDIISYIDDCSINVRRYIASSYGRINAPLMLESFIGGERQQEFGNALIALRYWFMLAKQICLAEDANPYECADDLIFRKIMKEIEALSKQQVYEHMKDSFKKLPEDIKSKLEDYFKNYSFWGRLDRADADYEILQNRTEALCTNAEKLCRLYDRLKDYHSKQILCAVIKNWYDFDMEALGHVTENRFKDYFDLDIMKCGKDEVLVDLGASIGDTVLDYISSYGVKYKRIYCYEIGKKAFKLLSQNLEAYPEMVLRQKAAASQGGTLYLVENTASDTANRVSDTGDEAIEAVAVDEDIKEPVTFIKMDIEGAEQDALRGCARHIREEKPKLAISVYHNNEDIWKIPEMIDEICPGYDFYLRYHGGNYGMTELTLLAVYGPKDK